MKPNDQKIDLKHLYPPCILIKKGQPTSFLLLRKDFALRRPSFLEKVTSPVDFRAESIQLSSFGFRFGLKDGTKLFPAKWSEVR